VGCHCGLGFCVEISRATHTKTSYPEGWTAFSLLFVCFGFVASRGAVIRFFGFPGF